MHRDPSVLDKGRGKGLHVSTRGKEMRFSWVLQSGLEAL